MDRQYSLSDRICMGIDDALRAVSGASKTTGRSYPATHIQESNLNQNERKHSAALMRVNHSGEVAAQALYQAQGFISRDKKIKNKMQYAAIEEGDHLAWCQKRLTELGSHTSYLNPFWYAGSFTIGLGAGIFGDKWNLGFLAETEQQVVQHLENHLKILRVRDAKSSAILQQMQIDEAAHRDEAIQIGAIQLPAFIKKLMGLMSKVMVKTAYWI